MEVFIVNLLQPTFFDTPVNCGSVCAIPTWKAALAPPSLVFINLNFLRKDSFFHCFFWVFFFCFVFLVFDNIICLSSVYMFKWFMTNFDFLIYC